MVCRCDYGGYASVRHHLRWRGESRAPPSFAPSIFRRLVAHGVTLYHSLRIVRHQLETDQLPSVDVAPKVRADGLPPRRMLLALARDLHFHVAPNGLWL